MLRHLDANSYATKPWKNGLGQTLEIAADGEAPFRWRVSSADVPSSGPFSAYDGYERTLVLLAGGPMTLWHDGLVSPSLKPLGLAVFQGESETSAVVAAPARDLNVFTLRGKAAARVAVHRLAQGASATLSADADETLLYCISGQCIVHAQNAGEHVTLAAGDTLQASRGGTEPALGLALEAHSDTAWVSIAIRLT